jgi:ATP-binding cassette subfamily B protein
MAGAGLNPNTVGPSGRDLLGKAIPLVRPFRSRFAWVLTAALLAAGLAAVEPLVVKRLFDELGGTPAPLKLLWALLTLLAVLIAREGLVAYRDAGAGQIRAGVHSAVTRATVSHLHTRPLSQHRESAGAVIAKMDRGINGAMSPSRTSPSTSCHLSSTWPLRSP